MNDKATLLWQGKANLREFFSREYGDSYTLAVGVEVSEDEAIRLLRIDCTKWDDVTKKWEPETELAVEYLEKDALGADRWLPLERLAGRAHPGSFCTERFVKGEDGEDEGGGHPAIGVNSIEPLNGEWVACIVAALLDLLAQRRPTP